MKKNKTQMPLDRIEKEPRTQSFRSVFKWGAIDKYKNPSQGFWKVIKKELGLSDMEAQTQADSGGDRVDNSVKSNISSEDILLFEQIAGKENLFLDTYSRLKYSTGKSMEDILNLREHRIQEICDLVLHPRDKEDIIKIVALCHSKKIPLHVYGGGSSVTLGLACPKGGVTLVMGTHMKRMVAFNETNRTITVESGMMGPVFEDLLNNAPEKLNAKKQYTGGHFPQSFEFSSVGGWVVTLGSGQASSYYGDACDLVISQEYVTPVGTFKTKEFPASATGPKVNDIMKGSEGCFGVLVSVTMKIFPFYPQSAKAFTFMFPNFEKGRDAARHISQAGFGMPAILRLSDPEETDVAMKMYGLEGSIPDRYMGFRGLKPKQRCLLMGQTDGEHRFSKNVYKQIKTICKANQGLSLTGYPMKKWYKGRFSDPYMRDALNDAGVLIDTLEASVSWDHFNDLYSAVRTYIKSYPHMICMTHASHFYAQGTNLYFIFITKMQDIETFRNFQRGIIEKIIQNHGSLSHHHGVGRLMAPMMEQHLGKEQMDVLKALKKHFDPNYIMNPGGLGV
ncbi:MAG: FAD-binding oxidoreductase [Desulfobacula sp.]|nr:FAD-binding oxidoreductase [Desulfobacula sp.]